MKRRRQQGLSNCTGSRIQCMLLVTNQCRALKDILFFDQSDKSPDSGLRADDELSKYIRHPFPGKKDYLIAGYWWSHGIWRGQKSMNPDRNVQRWNELLPQWKSFWYLLCIGPYCCVVALMMQHVDARYSCKRSERWLWHFCALQLDEKSVVA